ncbi:MAG: methionine synthase [Methanobacteriaceae archaeon]|jgi:5-methyltetrahydropteroyltriglutamate--homocysteine methyltransferase|nr:methionine synthase [Candidatus Methanorudis spinitermitis]
MISTVVGSYPVIIQPPKTRKNKLFNVIRGNDKCKTAIQHSVKSQVKAGIDIISDGQVRGDMVEIFAKSIPGCKIENNTCVINSKIFTPYQNIGVKDLKLAIKYMKQELNELNISSKDKKKKGVKGIISGPSTIVQSSKIGPIYKNKDLAIIDMANALKSEAIALEKAGAKIIQIDEPFLSTGLIDMEIAKEAINIISKNLTVPVAIHCCGDIKNIFDNLIDFNVDIIDCEFAGQPTNLDVLDSYSTNLKSKKIGLGVIDTKKQSVESVEEIAMLIEKGLDIVGDKNLFIDPDCGLRLSSDEIAFKKLKNMVEAMKLFN